MRELYGRRVIYSDLGVINFDNVTKMLDDVKSAFTVNADEERYLYDYYKGKQEIRFKTKETRPEINHIIVENRALAITDFKTGYLVGDPIVYTSRSAESDSADAITQLNEYMLSEDKASADKELVDWMHITGHGYRMVLPDQRGMEDDAPFEIYNLPPMRTFVVYSNTADHRPIAGVYYVTDNNNQEIYSVYTPTEYFEVRGGKVTQHKLNGIGIVPIIEYPLNEARLGVFEPVIALLDAINYLDSDRLDGVTTFINSLCVLYNAELPEGETGDTIRQQGLITLRSTGENKADIKILSEQLDQTSTQTLKDDLYNSVLQIVGMPNQSDGNTSDSSNNGAMFLKQGYQLAETRAADTELAFKRAERQMLKVVARICNHVANMDIKLSDIDITFTRRAYSDINSKATVLTTLLNNNYVAPIDAWTLSGITPDPDEATKRGLDWNEEQAKREQEMMNNANTPANGRDKQTTDNPDGKSDGKSAGEEDV